MWTPENSRKRRESLTQQGLCYICAKHPHTTTSKRCVDCSAKAVEAGENWAKNNKEHYKQIRREAVKRERSKLRKSLLEKLGGKCECCGEASYEFLQFDHLNSGAEHRKIKKSNVQIMKDMLNNPEEYPARILCANCHNAITYYGSCPHKKQ